MLLKKGILKTCSKFTGEHPYRNVISIKLLICFRSSHPEVSQQTLVLMKTSFVFVFRRRLDTYVFRRRLQNVFKTFWSRPIYSPWSYVFKASSRRFQDVLQKCLQDVFKTSSRRLAKTFSRPLQNVFKTSCKNVFKTSSRHLQDVLQRCLQDLFKTHHRVNLFLVTRFQDAFETFSKRF